ncbi:MAG: alpha/beta fold hydrolase, partial [Wenzhouxiangella sp.]
MRLIALFGLLFILPISAEDGGPIDAEPVDAPVLAPEWSAEPDEEGEPMAGLPEAWEWLRAPGYDTLVCPFRGQIDYEPGEVECGLIRVPENREVAGSRTIELNFIRIPARGEDADGNPVEVRPDPVIYLTGGPGVHVDVYVSRLKDHALVEQRDLIILEQRGIGNSGDFCPFFGALNRAEQIHPDWDDSQLAALDVAARCIHDARARGVDVSAYHTFENARDVKALRLALGLEDWNVWGISYGSVLGQAYMKVDPEGIRAVVLDAIVPLDLKDLMRIAHWHERNLAMLFAACSDQGRCARVFEGLEARYRSAIAAITEQPIELEVTPDERYPTGQAYLFQDLLVGLPFMLLYEESNHPAVPAIIDGLTRAAEKRDETFFRALALANMGGGVGMSAGMSMAVRCLDGYVAGWAENAPREFRDHALLARAFGSEAAIAEADRMCREAGLAPRDPAQFELVESDLPVVVANGAWDPITPVPLAEYILPGFSNGRLA